MVNGIRTGDTHGFIKGRGSKFRVGSRVRQRPGEGRNNNKNEDNIPKTLNDENHQASSEKFRQRIYILFIYVCI